MSQPIKANTGPVATLADTDLLVAVDSSGALRPVSLANLLAQMRSSLTIGGRNLLPGSMESMASESSSSYSFSDGVHAVIMNKSGMGMCKRISGTFPIKKYTVSVELKADVPMDIRWYLGNNETSAVSFAVTTEWRRYTATLTPTVGSLQFRLTTTNLADRFYARYPQIEEGNVATAWSPAPEDLGWGG